MIDTLTARKAWRGASEPPDDIDLWLIADQLVLVRTANGWVVAHHEHGCGS